MFRRPALTRADVLDAALLGPGYFALAAITVSLTRFDGGVAFIWVASAVLVVRLAMSPPARWGMPLAVCGIGNFAATTLFGLGPHAAPLMVVANLGEAAIGAWLLRRSGEGERCFETVAGVRVFVLASGIIAPLVVSVPAGLAAHLAIGAPLGPNMLHWAAGHALGTLAFAPIAMLIARGELARWRRRAKPLDIVEAAIILGGTTVVIAITFDQTGAPLLFLPMLPMMVATIRLGRFGAAVTTLMLAVIGGAFSLDGHGPLHLMRTTDGVRVLFFQGYLACAALLVLPVAALLKEQRALVRRLSESEAKYRVIAERVGDAVLDIALDGTIRYASPAMRELIGRDPATVVGTHASALIEPEDVHRLHTAYRTTLAEPGRSHTVEFRPANHGGVHWHETTMRAVATDEGGSIGVIASVRDVSERKAAERELAIQATTDPLTGLANRRAFQARLERAVAQAADGTRSISVALFDLDRFKAINDGYGHAAGDTVLRAFAEIARATLRQADCIGRIGGEEFAVLLCDVTPLEAAAAGDRLRRTLRATAIGIGPDQGIHVTVSVGVATVRPGLDADAVLRAADSALYRAKASGRDCLRRAA